jgi:hypothetical protein
VVQLQVEGGEGGDDFDVDADLESGKRCHRECKRSKGQLDGELPVGGVPQDREQPVGLGIAQKDANSLLISGKDGS